MRIGLARRGFSATGGAEKYLHRLMVALEGAGHECVLFAGRDWPAQRRPSSGLILVAGRTPRAFADALAALRPREHCDCLFSLERVWQCDAYRAGDGVHREWLERRTAAEPWWRQLLRGFNFKHGQILDLEHAMFAEKGAGRVIANSLLVRDEIVADYGYPASQISVIYNGLPADAVRPVTADDRAWSRASLELDEREFAVLFAGTGWRRKGLSQAITAIGAAPANIRPRLLVAGRGSVRDSLRGQSAQARERVRFLGPAAAMHSLYAAADLFVLPTYYDPFSNACLEALAAGLPVVTTQANGFAEIMDACDGEVLRTPDDLPGFSAAIERWSDPAVREAGREARFAKGARYSIERNVTETIAVLAGPSQAGAPPG